MRIMNLIKKYKIVIAVILPVLILILIKSMGTNHFSSDAKRWAETSISRSNIISFEKAVAVEGDKLIINLDEGNKTIQDLGIETIDISDSLILDKDNLRIIKDHKGPVLLFSERTALSARIWMVISQMGCDNIFVLTSNIDGEVFKYKFRPDTTVRPEL
jgi:hypothetical protein